jgi:hypothetical protein
MASTPIYNWPTPDNTDLVKNGALAIRTLGNAIDTTVDTMIPETIFAAKGDLLGASANDTPAVLTVGANGETLVADSSTSTGLRYQGSMAAGKNAIINGGMDIWQRGTSSVSFTTAYTAFSADRFVVGQDTAANGSATQVTTSLQGTFSYGLKMQRTAASASTNTIRLVQALETQESVKYAGQTVTFSFYAKAGANYSASSSALSVYVGSGTGTNQSPAALVSGWTGNSYFISNGTATLTTSWQRFTFTGTVSSSANQIGFQLLFAPTGTAGADDSYSITGIQLELGSVATTFTRAGGTLQGELAACQRYYQRFGGQAAYQTLGSAMSQTTTNVYGLFTLPVPMRVIPTSVDFSTLVYQQSDGGLFTISAAGFNSPGLQCVRLDMTTTGATANRPGQILTNNSTSAYVGFSAEL